MHNNCCNVEDKHIIAHRIIFLCLNFIYKFNVFQGKSFWVSVESRYIVC